MAAIPLNSTMCVSLALLASLAGCVPDSRDDGDDYGDGIETLGTDTDTGSDESTPTDIPNGEETEEEPPSCSSTTAVAVAVPPNVMLVIDKSRSMILYSWDDDGVPQTAEVTRWHSLYSTVETVADQYSSGMSLGLTLFPSIAATSAYDQACLVEPEPEVAIGSHGAADLLAVMPDADELEIYGATPGAAGIATALTHLRSLDDGRPAAMILITDGAANCNTDLVGTDKFDVYDEDLPALVSEAWMIDQIPTYVVGIDIEEASQHPFTAPREKLDEVAQLGGVPRAGEVGFYDAADADALLQALDEIAATVSCSVELGQAPAGPDFLRISIDDETIPHLDSCDGGSAGWAYTDAAADLQHIDLCNAACDSLLATGEVQAEFLCPPQP